MDAKLNCLLAGVVWTLATAVMPVAARNAADADIVGEARDKTRDELLYHELHYFSEQGKGHQVIYRAPGGGILAEKSLDYAVSKVQPELEQQNFACGEAIGVSHAEDSLEVSYRSHHQEPVNTEMLERQNELVIDAGFDHLLRQNWGQIAAGDSLVFDYLVRRALPATPFACGRPTVQKVRRRAGSASPSSQPVGGCECWWTRFRSPTTAAPGDWWNLAGLAI